MRHAEATEARGTHITVRSTQSSDSWSCRDGVEKKLIRFFASCFRSLRDAEEEMKKTEAIVRKENQYT